jgi:hypothetical protein
MGILMKICHEIQNLEKSGTLHQDLTYGLGVNVTGAINLHKSALFE